MADRCLLPALRARTGCSTVARALALTLCAFALALESVAAGVAWCRSDPVVVVDGQLADVFVNVPLGDLLKITGPTEIVITTPVRVGVTLAVPGVGFGYGEVVRFEESPSLRVSTDGIEVRIKVRVPARSAVPVLVEFSPLVLGILAPASAEGTANEWISLHSAI